MAAFLSRETRVRLFLAFLILVLVLVNSQSLKLSHQSRSLLEEAFSVSARAHATIIGGVVAPKVRPDMDQDTVREIAELLDRLEKEHGLRSSCILDWNVRPLVGDCQSPEGHAFDKLDRSGRRELLDQGWVMAPVQRRYDISEAEAVGYLVLGNLKDELEGSSGVLRLGIHAPALAKANRRFRTTVIYQVSALSIVLIVIILFLNSLLTPQRRLVAEARSVASKNSAKVEDEGQFLLMTFQDVVSQLKDKERQLETMHQLEKARADQSEALATDIIRSMTTGLVSLDSTRVVALINPAAEKIFGIDGVLAVGRPWSEIFQGSDELTELVNRAVREGSFTLRGQISYERKGVELIYLGVSVIPLFGAGGERRGALCLLADLTEVIQLRESLFLKENLARLGEMAAGIAHEFRNGLATILGNAKLLKDSSIEPESKMLSDALIEESLSLSRVVTEFLEFARPQQLRLEVVDLGKMAAELKSEFELRASKVGVQIKLVTHPARVEADDGLLRKAIANLLTNAIEAIAETRQPGTVTIETESDDDFGWVWVCDDGPGISENDCRQIFVPFFTCKSTGTGLGLSVVQKIAVSHNGSVELESPNRDGARFIFKIPVMHLSEQLDEWM